MKKIMKVTQGKRFLSLILSVVMMATVFNMALPMLKLDASAATTIDGVSQTRIVGTDGSYGETYAAHSYNYGNGISEPTNIVVPGLSDSENYVIQGMAYYPQKDWILVTAYHNSDNSVSSKVFCLDAVSGDFVAMISFRNPDGSVNYDHGGGIAISEHNIYYSCGDKDRSVAYAPLSALDGIQKGEHRVVNLVEEITLYETGAVVKDSKTAYTAYVCYDQGILWTGNFYDPGAVAGLVAADYNAAANSQYNSMVWGYRLSGNSSEEEWANLKNGDGSDCQGSPSYVIALNNNIKQVQYAVVDNGKLYLSCSYGTGTGNSTSLAGYDSFSSLHIADIDLTVPGTATINNIPVDAAGTVKSFTGAYVINDYQTVKMPPMSEGLCVVNDYVYMTFESASYKYYKDAGLLSNCVVPIDVVWKIDQLAALGVERPTEERSLYYEEVTSANFSDANAEYIIVYESTEKDPVTQRNYLYALNSNGGYKNNKLSKNNAGTATGYAGMEAHVITEYDISDGKLYLNNLDKDDVQNIRWNITNSGIKTKSTYFASQPYFYFTGNAISMTTASKGSEIKVTHVGDAKVRNGNFYLSNNDTNYLWCNDGTNGYETAINNWYDANDDAVAMYEGVNAKPGMIYADGLSTSNVMGKAVDTVDHGQFRIFKRVVDNFASTKKSKIYTDLSAELQADGTYTIDLETYATAPTQTLELPNARSTDFIFVLDASSPMQSGEVSVSGYKRWGVENNGSPAKLSNISLTNSASGFTGDKSTDYLLEKGKWTSEKIYYKTPDGTYCLMYGALKNVKDGCDLKEQLYWAYYEYNGKYYIAGKSEALTWEELETKVKEGKDYTGSSTTTNKNDTAGEGRAHEPAYQGVHYTYESKITRLDLMKHSVNAVIDKIAADSVNGKNHRFAIVQYGHGSGNYYNTGMYKNDGTFVQYNGSVDTSACKNAFFTKDQINVAKYGVVDYIVSPTDYGADRYLNRGYEMVNGIIDNSGSSYYSDSDRSLCVITVTCGHPGDGSSSEATNSANAAIAEIFKAKKKGASAYTIRVGSDTLDGFNDKLYFDYTSSEYNYAQSLSNSGVKNDNGIDYSQQVSVSDSNALNNFVNNLYNSISENTKNGYASLNVNSILKEELSSAFKIPTSNWSVEKNVSTHLVPGLYDAVGRVSFYEDDAVETTAVNVVQDTENKNLFSVSNFNYSDNYVGKGGGAGNKLRVTITGVLANEAADITNTSINNSDVTAIYHNNKAVKKFPTEYFNIPEYTYVLDYGLEMLDTDVNGTLKSISAGLTAQRDANGNISYKDASQKGFIEITENDLDLLYHTDSTTTTKDSGYVLIQRDSGKYDWFKINVVPGSNVLYEETSLGISNGNDGNNFNWKKIGNPTVTSQDISAEGDVYGYDSNYDTSATFSNGTHYYSVTNSSNKKSDLATFSFTGTGFDLISACGPNTGVQMVTVKQNNKTLKAFIVDTYYNDGDIKLLDDNGLLYQVPIVSFSSTYGTYDVEARGYYISGAGAIKNGKTTKSNLVDTGLTMNSAEFNGGSAEIEAILAEEGISAEDVELIWFDDNSVLNGGTGVEPTKKATRAGEKAVVNLNNYIDGLRVYNPLGTNPEVNKEAKALYSETEKNVRYGNIINNLAHNDVSGGVTGFGEGIAFITGSLSSTGEDGTTVKETLSLANYESFGPTNELYLKGNMTGDDQYLTFPLALRANERVMLGLRAVSGATKCDITSITADGKDVGTKTDAIEINSATEMYYDITKTLPASVIESGGVVFVTIKNTGSGVLAVNTLKLSGAVSENTALPLPRSTTRSLDVTQSTETTSGNLFTVTENDLPIIQKSLNQPGVPGIVKNGVVVPLVKEKVEFPGGAPETPDNPGDDNITPDVPEDDTTNDDTNTDSGEKEENSIFSLLELLISILEKLLYNAFGAGSLF